MALPTQAWLPVWQPAVLLEADVRSALARDPDLLARPLARPRQRNGFDQGNGVFRRLGLDQLLDLEAALAQHANHLAMRQVEIDRVVVGDLDAVHAKDGAPVLGADRRVAGIVRARA